MMLGIYRYKIKIDYLYSLQNEVLSFQPVKLASVHKNRKGFGVQGGSGSPEDGM